MNKLELLAISVRRWIAWLLLLAGAMIFKTCQMSVQLHSTMTFVVVPVRRPSRSHPISYSWFHSPFEYSIRN